jgi:hypothetical protein
MSRFELPLCGAEVHSLDDRLKRAEQENACRRRQHCAEHADPILPQVLEHQRTELHITPSTRAPA